MKDLNYDIVVMGGGGNGLTAAVRVAQHSGKKVAVLEKAGHTGGMNKASTMRTFKSRRQKERNLPDVTEDYLRKAMDSTYWRLDSRLVGNAILATGQFFDWFCNLAGGDVGDRFHVGRYIFDEGSGPGAPRWAG